MDWTVLRYLSLITAIIEGALFSGCILGWGSLSYVLKMEGFFRDGCENVTDAITGEIDKSYTINIPYSTHTVIILYSQCTHAVLIMYCSHTVIILYSCCTHTVLILQEQARRQAERQRQEQARLQAARTRHPGRVRA